MLNSQLYKTEKFRKLRIQHCLESKKFKFFNVQVRNEKKIGGYFLKKTHFSTFGGLKVPIPKIFFHGLKTFIFCQLKLFSKNFLVEDFKSFFCRLITHSINFPGLFWFFSLHPLLVADQRFPKRYNTCTFPWKYPIFQLWGSRKIQFYHPP